MQLAMKLCGDMLRLGATVMRQRLGKMKGAGIRNVRELWPNLQRAQKNRRKQDTGSNHSRHWAAPHLLKPFVN